jgi:hypothetical protein
MVGWMEGCLDGRMKRTDGQKLQRAILASELVDESPVPGRSQVLSFDYKSPFPRRHKTTAGAVRQIKIKDVVFRAANAYTSAGAAITGRAAS